MSNSSSTTQKEIHLINGFIRRLQLKRDISADIVTLCAAFYQIHEFFGLHGASYQLEADKLTIIRTSFSNENSNGTMESAFGTVQINSMTEMKHRWTFKVLQEQRNMSFGMTESKDDNIEGNCFRARRVRSYCATNQGRKWNRGTLDTYPDLIATNKTPVCGNTSVIVMEVDLKMKTISFGRDGKCPTPSCEYVECGEDIRYKMAIAFENNDSKVELVNYEEWQ